MIRKRWLLFAIGISITLLSFSQSRFEIGGEGGVTKNIYRISDDNDNLRNVPCISGIGGINFRVNTRKKLFFEIAALAYEYTEGMKLKQEEGYSVTNSDDVILLPLRMGYYLPLSDHFTIVPIVGFVPGIKTLNQQGYSSLQYMPNMVWTTGYTYTTRPSAKNLFGLIQGGLGLEYKCFKKIKFSFGMNYYQGLSKIAVYDIEYKINNRPTEKALMYGKGSFLNYNGGIKYLFGK